MKKIPILLLLVLAGFMACQKDNDPPKQNDPPTCASCINTPEAVTMYDHNSAGVYKGVIVGSTGTIALYLYNTGTEVEALVSFDGQSATLTTQSLNNWTPGQSITNAVFTGDINGETITAYFSVGENGENPVVELTIPDHNVVVAVYKETSAQLIKSFQGDYSGDESGTFNLVLNGDQYTIVVDNGSAPISGVLQNGGIHINTGDVQIDGDFQGTDYVSGTWSNSDEEHGNWTATRTL